MGLMLWNSITLNNSEIRSPTSTVIALHYYNKQAKLWSKLDLYPIYQNDMKEILSKDFEIEEIYHDFDTEQKEKSLFVQYLARRRS